MSQRKDVPAGKNGNIMRFFKPVSSPSSKSHSPSKTNSPLQPPAPAPPASSSPLSQRSVHVATTPCKSSARTQPLEIGASDEEDDDDASSDASLEDLSTLLGGCTSTGRASPVPGAARRTAQNPYATPRAKRTAVEFYSSPLTIMPKHKFDIKALAKDALSDNATNASSMRIAALNEASNHAEYDDDEAITTGVARNRDGIDSTLMETVSGKEGHEAQKVLRAVERSKPGQAHLRYCFFHPDLKPQPSTTAPSNLAKSPWRILTQGDAKTREQHVASGLPQALLQSGGSLPDELIEWMLDGICVERSVLLRQEYCNLIADSVEQVGRLLTTDRLRSLFLRLGASPDFETRETGLCVSRLKEEPYQEADWSCLQSFLTFLGLVASQMSVDAAKYAVDTLLRLSLDRMLICNINILNEHETALQALAVSIPRSSWDSFCQETCFSLHSCVETQCIRTNALLCIPVSHPRSHDLRRRLAITFLFDDPQLGGHNPDDIVTLRGILDRLDADDFTISRDTDYAELKAGIIMLDIAIDDGSLVPTSDMEDEKKFNADVDELAMRLREIWRKVDDSGMKIARTEAKSVIEWVQQRLSHSVRTRRKPKRNVFDIPDQREDRTLPQQQDFLQNFLRKKSSSAVS